MLLKKVEAIMVVFHSIDQTIQRLRLQSIKQGSGKLKGYLSNQN